MELFEKFKKYPIYRVLGSFPKAHILAISGLILSLGVISLIPEKNAEALRQGQTIAIPAMATSTPAKASDSQPNNTPITRNKPALRITTLSVKSGDTLSALFQRAGLNDRAMLKLLNTCTEAKQLTNLKPGQKFLFEFTNDNHLNKLTLELNKLDSQVYQHNKDGYNYESINRSPDIQTAYRSGTISQSLYSDGSQAGLDDNLIMELANIFGWDVDFALDIRKGDKFEVLYEEQFLDGEKLGNGHILAAKFINQGTLFSAVRYVDRHGQANYYSPTGESMRKAFLRAPLDFRRISSNFNLKRLHPIFKTIRPHRGTDYAAAVGTPVWASGSGRVIASSFTKANGNYIVIQHGNNIQTKYLHLSKRYVKKGDKVRQKQRIGSVGTTGYSTAPHLHYEFLLNGVHRNPRTIVQKLPKAKAIADADLHHFLAQTQPLVAAIDREGGNTINFAANDIEADTKAL